MHLLSFVVLALLASSAFSASYTFSPLAEQDCLPATGGCSFINVSIWLNGGNNATTFPQPADNVNITGYNTSVLVYIPTNTSIMVSSTWLGLAQLTVEQNSTFSSPLIVGPSAVVNANGPLITGSLEVEGALNIAETLNANGQTVLNGGDVSIAEDATAYFENVVYNPSTFDVDGTVSFGYLTFAANTTATFPDGLMTSNFTVPQYTTVTVNGNFTASSVVVNQYAVLTFNDAFVMVAGSQVLAGNGSITLVESSAHFIATNASRNEYDGHITANDNSTLVLVNLQIAYITTSSATRTVATNVTLVTATLDGVWIGGLNLTGVTTLIGTLSVATYMAFGHNDTGYYPGSLIISNSANLVLTGNAQLLFSNSTVVFGGYIAGNLMIPMNTSFTVQGNNATIFGNVVNHGLLILDGDHPLTVIGNLIHDGAALVTLRGSKDVSLHVANGSLSINGPLSYVLSKTPFLKDEKFLVAQLDGNSGNITGAFNNGTATAFGDSSVKRNLKIEYVPASGPNQIWVVYGFKVHDVPTWVWVVVAIVGVVVVASIVAIIVKCRHRRDYQPVP